MSKASSRANARFVYSHPAHALAYAFGAGLSPKAPGTVGTLWAWASFLVMQLWLTPAGQGLAIAVALVAGWWASTTTINHLGDADPGQVVIDEVAAFWLVLWLVMPTGFLGQLVAFGLFRYFDAAKPGPVGWADRLFHGLGWRGGLGVMLDDLVAAFCTLLVIALWRFIA